MYTNEVKHPINLDKIIKPYASSTCIVHISNYQSHDVTFSHPVMMFYLEPLHIQWQDSVSDKDTILLTSPSIRNDFVTGKWLDCSSSSKHFVTGGRREYIDLCVVINTTNLALNSKPWHCKQDVQLLPKSSYFLIDDDLLHYARLPISWGNILVSSHMNCYYEYVVIVFGHPPNQEEALLMTNSRVQKSKYEDGCQRFDVVVLDKDIGHLWYEVQFTATTTKFLTISPVDLLERSSNHYVNLKIISDPAATSIQEQLDYQFASCRMNIEQNRHYPGRTLLAMGQASLWLSILANHSANFNYQGQNIQCRNGMRQLNHNDHQMESIYNVMLVIVEKQSSTKVGTTEVLRVPNPFTAIRFVSCGRPSNSHVTLTKFFTMFDLYIWILLMTSLTTIVIILPLSEKRWNFADTLFSMFRLYA